MKVGLVRHFKVNKSFPERILLSKSELVKWFEEYDNTIDINYKNVELAEINWQHCYSSPMIRAKNTAKYIYKGQIREVIELKELDLLPQLSERLKLPFMVWGFVLSIMPLLPNNEVDKFKRGISDFLDNLIVKNGHDVLIVSHWFVMKVIRKELIKRGLSGANFSYNDFGNLSIYECKAC